MNPSKIILACLVVLITLVGVVGCSKPIGQNYMPTERERRQMLSLMLPKSVHIWPGTKIASFDDDEIPDGILAVVQPEDQFGDPIKAAGLFYFELWTYQQASAERKGRRLAFWSHVIDSAERLELHWTPAQMYEFQLGWTGGAEGIAPDKSYLLTVTYRTPWDTQMQDQMRLDFHIPGGLLGKPQSN